MFEFYSKDAAPDYLKHRTSVEYQTMPLTELKARGIWNRRLDKILPCLEDKVWIAGGFLRAMIAGEDDRNGDIDFFFGDDPSWSITYNMLLKPNEIQKPAFGYYSMPQYDISWKKLRVMDFNSEIPYRPNIQLVKMVWYDTPVDVIDSFDLSVCQIAIDKHNIYYAPTAFEDIKSKTIRVHRNTGSSLTLLNRLLKYEAKGYNVEADMFNRVEEEAIEVLNDPAKINEYFYLDKKDTKTHKRPASFLQRSWDYLADNPKSAEAFDRMMKKKIRPALGNQAIF
jgi:hypothetical protein